MGLCYIFFLCGIFDVLGKECCFVPSVLKMSRAEVPLVC